MIPTCMFCGTLDEAANECPTCGGVVYDVEKAKDRRLVEIYQSFVAQGAGDPNREALFPVLPLLPFYLFKVGRDFYKSWRLRRELKKRFTNRPLPNDPHSPYR